MPLRAYIDNQEIISIDQTDAQWNELKKRLKTRKSLLELPCCKQEGFLRTSSKGLKHFVHAKSENTCDWKPESKEHLQAKIEIIEACKENDWKAIPEFSEENWRADVLAIQEEKRIAFEVQWSKQTFEETKLRQKRYQESGVRGCWFFKTMPNEFGTYNDSIFANKEIPAFKIFKDENSNISAELRQEKMSLKSLVDALLKRKLKLCEHISPKPSQEITIVIFETSCWKCGKLQHCWTVNKHLLTVCNQDFYMMGRMWSSDDIDKHPEVYEAIKLFLKTDKGSRIKIGQLKNRYSKTVQKSYLSHGCFYCDSIFGEYFLDEEKLEARNDPSTIEYRVKINLGEMKQKQKHWCYSESGEFCE